MEAWMAFISIMAIVAIVVVGGGLIAFIAHMILGVFDNGKQSKPKAEREVLDYAQYKQLENSLHSTVEKDYDFEAINKAKAAKEKEMLEKENFSIYDLEDDKDDELEEIENRLKTQLEEAEEKPVEEPAQQPQENVEIKVEEPAEEVEEEIDNFDLENMLNEISNDIIEEEKMQNESEEISMSDELASYSIDDLLKQVEETEEDEEVQEVEDYQEIEEMEDEEVETVETEVFETKEESNEEIELLKAQLAELNKQLEEARTGNKQLEEMNKQLEEAKTENMRLEEINKKLEEAKTEKVEVVRIDMTEEECVARLETLEERLKSVKKQYKTNSKEYRPLKKVMNDLEKYQTKLRRKETVVAKKKVSLYGVNNYVDIDKEKAEKLANELELLDGLRLSVSHCEEVINANKDRFPILEHTNQILEDQIAHIEADIESTKLTLQKIREQNGNGEGSDEEGSAEE